QIVAQLNEHESLLIFWMERYIALVEMDPDDRQGLSWIAEIQHSRERYALAQMFRPPPTQALNTTERERVGRLLPALLHQGGNPLQQAFLAALTGR
ncbi:MAG: hypothetical protein AAF125_25070, partial [Chloroflexota bacterium]